MTPHEATLFDEIPGPEASRRELVPGAVLLRGFALTCDSELLGEIEKIAALASFRHMTTRGGFRMSAAMSNCGAVGWVTDRKGYRYQATDPETGRPWPAMPESFRALAVAAAAEAGFADFAPDSCLINRYVPGAKMSLHQDRNEEDFSQPIVSVSLGVPAMFLFGTEERNGAALRIPLFHGDIVVWGGPARLNYHGIAPLKEAVHPLLGAFRLNLTFRRALSL